MTTNTQTLKANTPPSKVKVQKMKVLTYQLSVKTLSAAVLAAGEVVFTEGAGVKAGQVTVNTNIITSPVFTFSVNTLSPQVFTYSHRTHTITRATSACRQKVNATTRIVFTSCLQVNTCPAKALTVNL